MREKRYFSSDTAGGVNDILASLRSLVQAFSIRARMCPDSPAWNVFSNLFCGQPFILSIVNLSEVITDFHRLHPGQLGGFPSARQGTDENVAEVNVRDCVSKRSGLVASNVRQRDISASCVLPQPCPFGLSVPKDVECYRL